MDSDSYIQSKKALTQILSKLEAEDILTPIAMTELIDVVEDDYQSIIAMIAKTKHTAYPVYKDRVDNIIGILYVHELLTCNPETFDLNTILHYPIFISENKNILELLEEFKKKHSSFAIVVDEHGAVRGIVTQTNILDSLWKSNDNTSEFNQSIFYNGSAYIIDPRLPLEEFNKKFSTQLFCEDCDSLGGFVIEKFTYVPELGEEIVEKDMKITVSKTEGAKLQELTVKFHKK